MESHSGLAAPAARGNAKSQAHGARRLAAVDYLSLVAIGTVVVLVSLPRLRAFALRENERDAIRMLRVLGDDAVKHGHVLSAGGLGALLATNESQRVRLEDLELTDGGRLRRHGYLFDAAELTTGEWVLRAWPWEHGRTGVGAFLLVPGGEVLGHANPVAAFSGPHRAPAPPRDPSQPGWVTMPRR